MGDAVVRSLVVAAAQPTCVPYDVAENARAHAAIVRSASAPSTETGGIARATLTDP